MELTLSRAEYRLLLDMVYIATWVMTAFKTEEDARTAAYEELEQKIFSMAEKAGFGHLIEYAAEFASYFPLRDFEENGPAHGFIDEYEDDSFWEQLTSRLAERDVIKKLGSAAKYMQLDPMERIDLLGEREEFYNEEFATHGLERLRFARPLSKGRGRIRPS